MFKLVFANITRRRLRSVLTAAGIAMAVVVLLLVDQAASSYRSQLSKELNSMGLHLMLVPQGCPYDAAARVLKGNTLETSLPESALAAAKQDPDVEIAAPLLIAAVPRPEQGRTDMFVGLTDEGIALKAWWKTAEGTSRFATADSVILGADAAQMEMRAPGDALFSPETGYSFRVAGILERSGTSDDSLFFVPLKTAQKMFNSESRLTAVAIRLRDPTTLADVSARLQEVPGAQVVTQTEMMGTFLNILGTVQALLRSIALVALFASIAGLMNTLLMSVAERGYEFSLFRALGASRSQLFRVVVLEALVLTYIGIGLGIAGSILLGESAVEFAGKQLPFFGLRRFVPDPVSLTVVMVLGGGVALIASFVPAWRASQVEPAHVLKGVD